jgi:Flp pilus assembly protein TadD
VPDSAELHGLLGSIHLANRDVPKALESMEASRRLRPGDPRAVLPLATLYRQLERPSDARRVLLEARAWLQANGGGHLVGQLDRMLQALPPDDAAR